MQINKIKVEGFRNIEETTIELGDITSLLSINSYGKSNFLKAIIMGMDFIHAPLNIKKSIMNYLPHKPLNKKILFKNFSFEIEFSSNIGNTKCQAQYGYSFAWQENETKKSKIKTEYLKIKEQNCQKYTNYILRTDNEGYYKSSQTGSCKQKINIDENELIINKLLAYDNIFYNDLIKDINSISVYIDSHFNTNNSYNIEASSNSKDYSLNSEINVPKSLYKIKSKYPDKYKLIVNTMKDIFPFIEDIECFEYKPNMDSNNKDYSLTDSFYLLLASEKKISTPIQFSNMSDGVKRTLLIFTILVLADINEFSIVGIEEPENSLNPKVLQRYLMALKTFSKNSKVIITSHSPYLTNYIDPKDIYIGLPNNDGLAVFSKIKETSINKLLKDANNYDMLVGDYIFDLMSGDEEDIKTISKYTG